MTGGRQALVDFQDGNGDAEVRYHVLKMIRLQPDLRLLPFRLLILLRLHRVASRTKSPVCFLHPRL
jgi:hypothetical protein